MAGFHRQARGEHALGRPIDYGAQEVRLGGVRVFVLPSPSGAARRYWDAWWWRELARLVQGCVRQR